MAFYRKKPVVIMASQWFKEGDHPAVEKGLQGFEGLEAYSEEMLKVLGEDSVVYFVRTLEGPMFVSPGDWIITGVKGEVYPCKPDIFEMTYEYAGASA